MQECVEHLVEDPAPRGQRLSARLPVSSRLRRRIEREQQPDWRFKSSRLRWQEQTQDKWVPHILSRIRIPTSEALSEHGLLVLLVLRAQELGDTLNDATVAAPGSGSTTSPCRGVVQPARQILNFPGEQGGQERLVA